MPHAFDVSNGAIDASASVAPHPADWAFFLDLDGTLLDLAEAPDAVRPADDLQHVLTTLEAASGGALAIVTGRAVSFVDQLFAGHSFTVAGLHGAQLRLQGQGAPAIAARPAGFVAGARLARAAAQNGVLFEDKGDAFALHYRQAPAAAKDVHAVMTRAQQLAGADYKLRPGKFVVELAPARQDKGDALRHLMTLAPFLGRRPFAAGDDVTDEAMFKAARDLGGFGLRVGARADLAGSAAAMGLPNAAAFRHWIRSLTP
ncbi:trehalose 6-phosphate phosphatase [Ketogulonicigenium robustum]|uniref:Trehalose 6-phosphate phosphatase n=1 Tax=Ketogulonicigenium robustum TaxID=92947 RepID=A0A1W6NW22_9RHOB|nr:trehalose 6-phosphate phosphatase [Ketogulonicigenium robustum]